MLPKIQVPKLKRLQQKPLLKLQVQQQKQVILVLETTDCPEHHTLLAILNKHGIPEANLIIVDKMPVDGRHNSKIDRPALLDGIRKKRWPILSLSPQINVFGVI